MRTGKFVLFLFIVCIGFSSAGFFGDVFGGVTGKVIDSRVLVNSGINVSDVGCVDAKNVFDEKYVGYKIPEEVPFRDDVFEVYIDEIFFASFELVNKSLLGMSCEVLSGAGYRVYVKSSVIESLVSGNLGDDPVKFYNEKKKNGDVKIKAVGFGKKMKLTFINIGIRIAGFFR